MIEIYTDGSAGARGPGGWAAIVLDSDTGRPVHYVAGGAPDTTNNDMEFTAALMGIRSIWDMGAHIVIRTDSELLVGYMCRGYAEGSSKTKPKPHLQEHRENMRAWIANFGLDVKWEHVRGHAGNAWNEMADKIAGQERRFMESLVTGVTL